MAVSVGRAALFGIRIDRVSLETAVERVLGWVDQDDARCRIVVTPNVDHVVLLRTHSGLREVYQVADLVLADGFPIVKAARWLGQPLPGRVAGSDLVPALLAAARTRNTPLRVFLLGAAAGVADRAARSIEAQFDGVEIVGTHSPALGFEHDDSANAHIIELVAATRPDILVVGLGAPKQELWVHRFRNELLAPVALCAGATIDFLAGERARAPRWMQRCGLEWLHRLASDPKRLARRYAHDALVFPQLLWHERLHLLAARRGEAGPVTAAFETAELAQADQAAIDLDAVTIDLTTEPRVDQTTHAT